MFLARRLFLFVGVLGKWPCCPTQVTAQLCGSCSHCKSALQKRGVLFDSVVMTPMSYVGLGGGMLSVSVPSTRVSFGICAWGQARLSRPLRNRHGVGKTQVVAPTLFVGIAAFEAGRMHRRGRKDRGSAGAQTRSVANAGDLDTRTAAISSVRIAASGRVAGGLFGSVPIATDEVIQALEILDQGSDQSAVPASNVEGRYELVFSSSLSKLPVVEGFMPNREVLTFDFSQRRRMSLSVETLPFLPAMDITGEDCAYDEKSSTISYRISGKDQVSTWRVLYADGDVLVARSSVTGLNIARKLHP